MGLFSRKNKDKKKNLKQAAQPIIEDVIAVPDDEPTADDAPAELESVTVEVEAIAKTEPEAAIEVEVEPEVEAEPEVEVEPEVEAEPKVVAEAETSGKKPKKEGFFSKLKNGLKNTRSGLLRNIFSTADKIDDEFYEELEEALIIADVGMETTEKLIERLKEEIKARGVKESSQARQVMIEVMEGFMAAESEFALEAGKKAVLLIVGVNGVGKTTSIGKLAHYYKEQGYEVMMAAGDTFRAAAAEQLTEWANRAGVAIVKQGEGADPAAVVYDAMMSYKARGRDVLICDTAGRLHNKKNLMAELSKIRRVISRDLPEVPVETLLVLDATTGQNAIKQAQAFAETAELTGLILTKLDGTAKGGVALAVKEELGLPIRFVGVGEGIDDMQPFSARDFATALLATE